MARTSVNLRLDADLLREVDARIHAPEETHRTRTAWIEATLRQRLSKKSLPPSWAGAPSKAIPLYHDLGDQTPDTSALSGLLRVEIPPSLPPGQPYTFRFPIVDRVVVQIVTLII